VRWWYYNGGEYYKGGEDGCDGEKKVMIKIVW
jgi:hypothetical protein